MEFDEDYRKHGLQPPFNALQIISWIVFLYEILSSYTIYIPPLPLALKIVFGIMITIALGLTFYYAYKASISDPTDQIVYDEREARQKKYFKKQKFETKLIHYCIICNSHVGTRTKHCGQCNRCVEVFDHHCVWLNNCVGKKNYRLFIMTITSLLLQSTIKFAFGVYLIVQYHTDGDNFNYRASEYYNDYKEYKTLSIFIYISTGLNLILALLVAELSLLHVWLKKNGLTTYEYILKKRDRAEKKKEQSDVESKKRKSKTIKTIDEIENNKQAVEVQNTQSDVSQLRLLNKGSLEHSSTVTDNKEVHEYYSKNDLSATEISQFHSYKQSASIIHGTPEKTSDQIDGSFEKTRNEVYNTEESKDPDIPKYSQTKLNFPDKLIKSNIGKMLMMGTGIDMVSDKDNIISPKAVENKISDKDPSVFRSIESNVVTVASRSENKKFSNKKALKNHLDNPAFSQSDNQMDVIRNTSVNSKETSQSIADRQDFTLGSARSFGRRDDTLNISGGIRNDL